MRKVSTLSNLALKALKIVPASKQKWYTVDKKGLNVCLLKLHSNPPHPHPPHTHTQTIQTIHKQAKPKNQPQTSHTTTSHQQTSHITHNPAKYRTNYPLIFISQKLHSSFPEDIFYDSGHKNRNIFHPTTLLPNTREKRNRWIFLSSWHISHFAFPIPQFFTITNFRLQS